MDRNTRCNPPHFEWTIYPTGPYKSSFAKILKMFNLFITFDIASLVNCYMWGEWR